MRGERLRLLAHLAEHGCGSVGGGGGLTDRARRDGRQRGLACIGSDRRVVAELHRLTGAGIDGAGVQASQHGLTDDVGDEEEDDLVLLRLFALSAEEVLEEGDLAEEGGSVDALESVVLV